MPSEVVMPRLGWTMEVGRVVEWLKRDGDPVEAGEFLFLVETEKAVTEVEALDSGVLHIPPEAPAVGEDVVVGAMLAWIVPPGEAIAVSGADPGPDVAGRVVSARQPLAPAVVAAALEPAEMPNTSGPMVRPRRPAISPRARRSAEALGVDWTLLVGSGSSGRIVDRDIPGGA